MSKQPRKPTGTPPNTKVDPEESRGRERDLDSLIAVDLASGSPAAAIIWKAVEQSVAAPANVRFQTKRRDHRTTDVEAAAGDLTLLIENKVAGGQYEPGQAESYAEERRAGSVLTLTIGPRSFESYFHQKRGCFDAFVTIEDLAASLCSAAERADSNPELRAGYLHRAGRYQTLATSITAPPKEDVVAFGKLYRQVAEQRTLGRVRLSEGSFQRGPRATFAFDAPVPRPLRAMHKVRHRVVDILFRGWTLQQLEDFWSTMDEAERPRGWVPAAQKVGRDAQDTGEPIPVLRYAVDGVPESPPTGLLPGAPPSGDQVLQTRPGRPPPVPAVSAPGLSRQRRGFPV